MKIKNWDLIGNSIRRGTSSECCPTDSNASSAGLVAAGGGGNKLQQQQPTIQISQITFGDEDSSCDSHTRWGKPTNQQNSYQKFSILFC